jgi:hypothetical protein
MNKQFYLDPFVAFSYLLFICLPLCSCVVIVFHSLSIELVDRRDEVKSFSLYYLAGLGLATLAPLLLLCVMIGIRGGSLHYAARSNQHQSLELFLSSGSDPNKRTLFRKTTPLHLAAANCHAKCISILLRFQADCNLPDRSGETPLQLAQRLGKTAITQLLLLDCQRGSQVAPNE